MFFKVYNTFWEGQEILNNSFQSVEKVESEILTVKNLFGVWNLDRWSQKLRVCFLLLFPPEIRIVHAASLWQFPFFELFLKHERIMIFPCLAHFPLCILITWRWTLVVGCVTVNSSSLQQGKLLGRIIFSFAKARYQTHLKSNWHRCWYYRRYHTEKRFRIWAPLKTEKLMASRRKSLRYWESRATRRDSQCAIYSAGTLCPLNDA